MPYTVTTTMQPTVELTVSDGEYESLLAEEVLNSAVYVPTGEPAATSRWVTSVDDERGDVDLSDNYATLAALAEKANTADLGGAAVLDVGTTAGTVAAGNDTRITGALSAATASTTYAQIGAVEQWGNDAVFPAVVGDLLSLSAANSDAPFTTLATPDGSGQLVHPSIVARPEGWNGWRYWMAATPYAGADTDLENPCIYAANDPTAVGGADGWRVPTGLTNPIEATPATGYNSDPDLVFSPDGSTLYCIWRTFDGTSELIYARSSTDGVTWSARSTLITNDPLVRRPASPAVLWDGSKWCLWAVDVLPSPNTIVLYTNTSEDPTAGTWTGPTVTPHTIPGWDYTTHEPWHIDVVPVGDQLHMLMNDTTRDVSGSGGDLYSLTSADGGLTWHGSNLPVLSRRAGQWDTVLYRSTLVPEYRDGAWGYLIVYAGIAAGSVYRIGCTWAPMQMHASTVRGVHGVADMDIVNILAATKPVWPFVAGDTFARADDVVPGTSDSGLAWATWAGTPIITGRHMAAQADVNTKAALDAGIADGHTQLTISAIAAAAAQAWLLFRGADTNNYWRLGFSTGAGSFFKLDKVVGGAATTVLTMTPTYLTGQLSAGIPVKLAATYSGSTIKVWVYDKLFGTVTDAAMATNTYVGWQTQSTSARFESIYTRALVNGL